MVRISEDLVRKRAEHNEGEIHSLEELSLHQQDIEKIEHLDKWCKSLKILYLQNNLIAKIENVGRLKKLEYLNLALNNIEKIENLQGCESLKKLDLTVNFIGELTSIESLKGNIFFEELYLTGNPCSQFEGYKEYVVATLPQLCRIDGQEIEKSERIKALQVVEMLKDKVVAQQRDYLVKRQKQKVESEESNKENIQSDDKLDDFDLEQEKNAEFWNEKVEYTPETRVSIQNKIKESKEKNPDTKFKQPEKIRRERRLFNEDGNPVNVNEGKINFKLTESDDDSSFILDVACYKFMDTSLIEADVQPWYVRVMMKGDVLQLVLMEEVKPDSCSAKRSQTTGHLIITMPKLNPPPVYKKNTSKTKSQSENAITSQKTDPIKSRQFLEVTEQRSLAEKLANITTSAKMAGKTSTKKKAPENSVDFIDDPDVPPLM